MYNILKLNKISNLIDTVFNNDYNVAEGIDNAEGILVRSFKMHDYSAPSSLLAVARAGAGVNNIPIDAYREQGIVVFNTPGANANAVKELVIGSLINASRNIYEAANWAKTLKGGGEEVKNQVEKGKSAYAGTELLGKTIGVIGLGAIGGKVADSCIALGMKVIGYDPYFHGDITRPVCEMEITEDINYLYENSDYITIHTPYLPSTKGFIDAKAFSKMKKGVILLNCSRGELVDTNSLLEAIANKTVRKYVTDFACEEMLCVDNILAMPHLGASTEEAEDNCAIMAARELADYLQNGNITNSVNFPNLKLNREAKHRVAIIAKGADNLPNITNILATNGISLGNMGKANKYDIEYMLIDTNDELNDKVFAELNATKNVLKVRLI